MLTIYRIITVLNLEPIPFLAFAIELITSTATKTGAIAFNAPTNTLPRTEMKLACGKASANTTPINKPIN